METKAPCFGIRKSENDYRNECVFVSCLAALTIVLTLELLEELKEGETEAVEAVTFCHG